MCIRDSCTGTHQQVDRPGQRPDTEGNSPVQQQALLRGQHHRSKAAIGKVRGIADAQVDGMRQQLSLIHI